jgi:hypothetical protein
MFFTCSLKTWRLKESTLPTELSTTDAFLSYCGLSHKLLLYKCTTKFIEKFIQNLAKLPTKVRSHIKNLSNSRVFASKPSQKNYLDYPVGCYVTYEFRDLHIDNLIRIHIKRYNSKLVT